MAITKADVLIWLKLADEKKIPSDPDVLELGEGEWYGDYSVRKLPEFIDKYAKDSDKESLNRWYKDMATDPRPWPEKRHICFDLVKLFYKTVLQFRNVTSIDLHGTANALKLDLNYSLNASKQYDVIINTGTIEHVFNAGQAFISCHNLCKEQGLMFHVFPFQGWLDHGFWNINPTLLADLAAANNYLLESCVYFELEKSRVIWLRDVVSEIHRMEKSNSLGKNSLLYFVWKKQKSNPFVIPIQGYYSDALNKETKKDWMDLR